MSLKTRTLLVILSLFAIYGVTSLTVYRWVIHPVFLTMEHRTARDDLERALRTLNREVHHLSSLCFDWSSWDDTYDFIHTLSNRYIKSNLGTATFTDNNINLLYIYDTDGRRVWGLTRNNVTGKPVHLPRFPEAALLGKSLREPGIEKSLSPLEPVIKGIIADSMPPMMVVSRPILTSNNTGPPRGTFIMGRFLDRKLMNTMVNQTGVNFRILPTGAVVSGFDIKKLAQSRTVKRPVFQMTDNDRVRIYTTLSDIEGKYRLAVISDNPLKFLKTGGKALKYAAIWVISGGLMILFIMMWFTRKAILNPLERLKRHSLMIEQKCLPSETAPNPGKNEIASLKAVMDRLFKQLSIHSDRLKEADRQLAADDRELRDAEKELSLQEKYFRTIIEHLNDEIVVIDRNGRITETNRDFLKITGLSRTKVMGRHYIDVFGNAGIDVKPLVDNIAFGDIFQTGRTVDCRLEGKMPDGGGLFLDVIISPIPDLKQKVSHGIMAIRNVTDSVIVQENISHFRKIEAISTMAGGVAHEFNNLLMSIMLNIESVLKKKKEEPFIRESLEIACNAGERAKTLIRQMLLFSRQSDDTQQLLTVTPLVKESIKLLQPSLPYNVEFEEYILAEKDTVLASPDQIHQILVGLCSNAVKALAETGGKLGITLDNTGQGKVSGSAPNRNEKDLLLRLSVSDHGKGISRTDLTRIFDPFFTLNRPGEGSGLGLSAIHGMVKELGGSIQVESELGKGSTFNIYLPVADPVTTPETPPLHNGSGGKAAILLVEDEMMVAETLESVLRRNGYRVDCQTESTEALRCFKSDPARYDLLITDLIMPGMNGIELIEKIVEIRSDIPVILTTGYDEHTLKRDAAKLGVRAIVKKPVFFSELIGVINSILIQNDDG